MTEDGDHAEYTGQIYTPAELFEYAAALGIDGTATLQATTPCAASDDEKRLMNIARSTARAAKRKRDDGLPPWPHRIVRWRK